MVGYRQDPQIAAASGRSRPLCSTSLFLPLLHGALSFVHRVSRARKWAGVYLGRQSGPKNFLLGWCFLVVLATLVLSLVSASPTLSVMTAALVYPDRPAIVAASGRLSGAPPRTWRETRARCTRLAGALAGLGVARHDVVI